MTLLPAVAIAVVVTWALGGGIARLSDLSFRATWTIYIALAVQLVLFTPLADGDERVSASASSPRTSWCLRSSSRTGG